MLPEWRAESIPGGFIMISLRVAAERRLGRLGKDGPGLCPIGVTVGQLPVVAVPLLAVWDPTIALSPVEGLDRDCAKAGEEHCCTRWLV